jgi:hypothetical protein
MALPTPQSPTHAPPRITVDKFIERLKSKNSPAVLHAYNIWSILVANGVDPSFALAQYRVESQYGTSGHATVTDSWGNMLYDSNLTLLSGPSYKPGNGYTYATYNPNRFEDAVEDYCRYLAWYRDRYGLEDIYGATARWTGKVPGTPGHLSYCNTIVNDMVVYEFPPGTFYNSGDGMIYAGASVGRDSTDHITGQLKRRYPIKYGDKIYRGPSLDLFLKTWANNSPNQAAWYLGEVNGSFKWGALLVGTSVADPDGTVVYIPNIDKTKIITV